MKTTSLEKFYIFSLVIILSVCLYFIAQGQEGEILEGVQTEKPSSTVFILQLPPKTLEEKILNYDLTADEMVGEVKKVREEKAEVDKLLSKYAQMVDYYRFSCGTSFSSK